MMQGLSATYVGHHKSKWALVGGQVLGSDWFGATRLFSKDIPLAKSRLGTEEFPLAEYETELKQSEQSMWSSGSHGVVQDVCWLPRPGLLIVGTCDGAVLQLTQNLLDESNVAVEKPSSSLPPLKASQPKPKADTTPSKKSSMSRVLYRHPVAVHQLKPIDNQSGIPHLVSSNISGHIIVFEMGTGKPQNAVSKWAHPSRITALATSYSYSTSSSTSNSQNPTIASASADGSTILWDIRLAKQAHQVQPQVQPNQDPTITSLAFNPSNQSIIAMGMLDKGVLIYDLRNTSTPLYTSTQFGGAVRSMSFAPESDRLAIGCDDGHVTVWETTNELKNIYSFKHGERVSSVNWNPETAGELVSSSWDGLLLRHVIELKK